MRKVFSLFILAVFCIPFISFAESNDIDSAISWLYENQITRYDNKTAFGINKSIRRDEAAKLISQFIKNIMGQSRLQTVPLCAKLTDVPNTNTMRTYIMDICNRGLIKGNNGKFNPNAGLSNAQGVALVIKMIEGSQYEGGSHWSNVYYELANDLGLLEKLNLSNKNKLITRGDFAILLYRAGQLPDIGNMNGPSGELTSFDGTDLIINSLSMKKNSDGYWYHQFTLKNIGSIPYEFINENQYTSEFDGKDRISCSYQNDDSGRQTTIDLNLSGFLDPGKTIKVNSSIEQSSKIIAEGDYTGFCHLYVKDANQRNNNFTFRGKEYYTFLKNTTSNALPDLIINYVGVLHPSLDHDHVRTPDDMLMVYVKNIGSGTAYISQSVTLKPVCSGPPDGKNVPSISKSIATSETISAGTTFIIRIPLTESPLNHCLLYYDGAEIGKENNSYDFELIR